MSDEYQPASAITLAREGSSTFTLRFHLPRSSPAQKKQALVLLLYLAALAAAVYGCIVMRGVEGVTRSEERELATGAHYFAASCLVWLLAELIDNWGAMTAWWRRHDRLGKARWLARILPLLAALKGVDALFESMTADTVLGLLFGALGFFALALFLILLIRAAERFLRRHADTLPGLAGWIKETPQPPKTAPSPLSWPSFSLKSISLARILLFALAALSSAYVWVNSTGNRFLPPTFVVWLVSVALWALALAPSVWQPFLRLRDRFTSDLHLPWRKYWWAFIAFALIMVVGIHFRLADLHRVPPELYNDVYLNVVDAFDFAQGKEVPVYFAYNNGRPIIPIYWIAALASLPGLGFDFFTGKLATAIVSVIALPAMFWLGLEFAGARRRDYGIALGLLLAGLVAVSAWNVIWARFGLGLGWLPLITALLGVFLIRCARHNRRSDFILAGLALGFALYTKETARFFPLAAVAAVLLAMLLRKISWRERLTYVFNLAVMAFAAFMVFLPMFHYMLEYPRNFWQRAHHVILDHPDDEDDRFQRLERVASAFMSNARHQLLMHHWRGDRDTGRGLNGQPTLDPYSGGLLIIGLAAMLARMLRARDPGIWMLPFVLLIMHLPAVVAVSDDYALRGPNAARTIGALSHIFLLAAFPLAIIARQFARVLPKAIALLLATLLSCGMLAAAYHHNKNDYFENHHNTHVARTMPTSEGGKIIRGFVESHGAYGNAFIIRSNTVGEPRFVAAEAGVLYFPNVIWNLPQITNLIFAASRRDEYPLDADRDLLFLFAPNHHEATEELLRLFPQGYMQVIPSKRRDNHAYAVYRVPALGDDGMYDFLSLQAKG